MRPASNKFLGFTHRLWDSYRGPLSECDDPDAYFAFGLDLLLAGIEEMAARKR